MNRRTTRIIAAFLIAPIGFGALLWIFGLLSGNLNEGLWALKYSALFGYPIALITGVPAYLLMAHKGWTGPLAYSGLAVVYAVVLSGWLFVRPALVRPEYVNPTALALQFAAVLIGCIVTLGLFWLIARPDKAGR